MNLLIFLVLTYLRTLENQKGFHYLIRLYMIDYSKTDWR